ncbi:hypothetical protein [Streptomyces sp. NPDC095602]|uniref:hypothetical protein n=1 Tax=Streptomyces sp. NPDC095602 TaxID=3155819 RepID=UPI00332406E3
MRTSRLAPVMLAALLALAGCTSVQGRPPAPSPAADDAPAAGRPSRPVPPAAPPAPAAPREELADAGPGPSRAAASRRAAERPPRPADTRGAAPGRDGRPAAGDDPGAQRPAPLPRPAVRQSVQMRDLCQAARGTVDPSLAELCRRTYG